MRNDDRQLVHFTAVSQFLFAHGYDYQPQPRQSSVERFTKPGWPPIVVHLDRGVVKLSDFERIKADVAAFTPASPSAAPDRPNAEG
jgi:hypothetical protein